MCNFQYASKQRAPHLKGHYYVYLRKFLVKNKIQMEFSCVNSPKLEQVNGQFIMNEAYAKPEKNYLTYPLNNQLLQKLPRSKTPFRYLHSR